MKTKTGKTDPAVLQSEYKWFRDGYKGYQPDETVIGRLKKTLPSYHIIIFGGTWCHDTQRILPQFYKAIDQAGYSRENTSLYLVDLSKHSPERLEEKYNLKAIPTFIILKDEVETGRIVENTNQSIEADLAAIAK